MLARARLFAALLPMLSLPAQQAPAAPATPAAPAADDLAPLLAPLLQKHGVPALGAAVIVDGRLAALGVAGVRRRGRPEAVQADDRWHLGSCTKAMTATLLARDVEAGRLQWTTTVAAALPDLADRIDAKAAGITLRHLLTHRSGLPAAPPPELWQQLHHFAGTDAEARTAVCRALLQGPPEAVPGQRFLYSNAGYMVAGAIAERAGKTGWALRLQRELFTPLGMQHTGFGAPGHADQADQPWGHPAGRDRQPEFADNPTALGPAGTVHASLRDWAAFAALHLGVAGGDGKPLLTTASLQQLHDDQGTGQALGWMVTTRSWAPGPILTHSGSNTLWFCVAWLAPAARFAVLVTCNQGDGGAACDAVAAALVQRYRLAK